MSRWRVAILLVLVAAASLIAFRPSGASALQDTDTAFLLDVIRERNAPLSWFTGDWPLLNHFYRPISTLPFELDNRLYGNQGGGYVLTNAIIAVLCVLALFWFLRELTDRPWIATSGTLLFALWQSPFRLPDLTWPFWLLGLAILLGGLMRHGFRPDRFLPALFLLTFLAIELWPEAEIRQVIGWLPARTATVMTLFCLVAMASYARYERLSAARDARPEPTPLDPPATRTSRIDDFSARPAFGWLLFAFVAAALAFGSYEQAVMLPAALLGTAIALRRQGLRVRWTPQIGFWLLLVGYLVLRWAILPRETSGYQAQQFRSGPGVALDLLDYALPNAAALYQAMLALPGWIAFLTPTPWVALWNAASDLVTGWTSRVNWRLVVTGYLLSIITFLPMAWLKTFPHYHYWPLAMRALFVVALLPVLAHALVSAWSPRAVQAPSRRVPAPGSLPRP